MNYYMNAQVGVVAIIVGLALVVFVIRAMINRDGGSL